MGKKSETTKPAASSARATKKTEPAAPSSVPPAEKKPAKKTLKKTAASKPAFTDDDIALRAYFIAEKRHRHGIPGDTHHDWLEAERQLLAESGKKPMGKKKA